MDFTLNQAIFTQITRVLDEFQAKCGPKEQILYPFFIFNFLGSRYLEKNQNNVFFREMHTILEKINGKKEKLLIKMVKMVRK